MGRRQAMIVGGISQGARRVLTFGMLILVASLILTAGMNLSVRGDAVALTYAGGDGTVVPTVRNADEAEITIVADAISDLAYEVDPAAFVVRIVEDDLDEMVGAYLQSEGVILLQRRLLHEDIHHLSRVLAHEIGHLVDDRFFLSGDRARFSELRGHESGLSWYAWDEEWEMRPAEDFAEVFAVLADPTTTTGVMTTYGRPEDTDMLRSLVESALPDGTVRAREGGFTGLMLQAADFTDVTSTETPMGVLLGLFGTVYSLSGVRRGIVDGRALARHTRP